MIPAISSNSGGVQIVSTRSSSTPVKTGLQRRVVRIDCLLQAGKGDLLRYRFSNNAAVAQLHSYRCEMVA